jgi:putative endopeptidase
MIALISLFTMGIIGGGYMASAEPMKPIDERNLDKATKPGDDFYNYANGGWMKNNPIPAEYSIYGAFTQIYEDNLIKLKKLFEKSSSVAGAKKGSVEQQIGDYYFAGMNEQNVEKLGFEPVKPWLNEIKSINDVNGFISQVYKMHTSGLYPLFAFYAAPDETNSNMIIANLYQSGLGLGDRDYYLNDDKRSMEIRDEYVIHIAKMFELIGYNQTEAEKVAQSVFEFEKNLAKISRTRLELRDPQKNYNKMKVGELISKSGNFDWNMYFSGIGLKGLKQVNVGQPDFFKGIGQLVKTTSIEFLRNYLTWHLLHGSAPYLSSGFVNENFRFFGKVFTGSEKIQDRWKRVLNQTSSDLGEAVGKLYVQEYFPPEAKKKMITLVENLRKALKSRIEKLEWMSSATKKEALAKLSKIKVKIGYPDKWIDYSSVDITRDNYFMNTINASRFQFKKEIAKVGKAPDRLEWGMTPQTVNAYYSPNMNEIVFPAAILEPPFFDLKADDAVNYAAIGTVIGHEMTHGFDDQGRQYDKDGNLKDWWTEEDAKKFNEKVEVLVKQYDNFVAIDTMSVNGNLTLGENIADLGGITVSYEAWLVSNKGKIPTEKIDGFTPQERFFLSYAQVWRNNIRDKELMRRLKEDVHSPGRYRVNGVLPHVQEFYDVFKITDKDKMFINPENRAKIW